MGRSSIFVLQWYVFVQQVDILTVFVCKLFGYVSTYFNHQHTKTCFHHQHDTREPAEQAVGEQSNLGQGTRGLEKVQDPTLGYSLFDGGGHSMRRAIAAAMH